MYIKSALNIFLTKGYLMNDREIAERSILYGTIFNTIHKKF